MLLSVGNGRFGKDAEVGEFTCLSGKNPSIIDYILVGLELVKYTMCVEVLSIIGSNHFPVEVKLSLITGIMGKANVVKNNNDDFEKNVYYKKPLKADWRARSWSCWEMNL